MKPCLLCKERVELGHYRNPKLHHCRDCHRTWTGTSQAHCVGCHHHFSSNSAADRHVIDGECRPPEQCVTSNGVPLLGLRTDKWGRTWSFAGDGTPWWLAKHESLEDLPEGMPPPTGTAANPS